MKQNDISWGGLLIMFLVVLMFIIAAIMIKLGMSGDIEGMMGAYITAMIIDFILLIICIIKNPGENKEV